MPPTGNLHVTSREQGSTRVLSVTGQVDVATVAKETVEPFFETLLASGSKPATG